MGGDRTQAEPGAEASRRDGAVSAGGPGETPTSVNPSEPRPRDDRRRALARAIVRLLREAIVDLEAFDLVLDDGGAGAPTASDHENRTAAATGRPVTAERTPRATAIIRGPDALGRLLFPLSPDGFAEGFLRGDGIARAGVPGGSMGPDLRPRTSRFVDRYVFPDGELVPVEEAVALARAAGFEVIDVQSLRPHYALTLAAWIARLEASWPAAVGAAGDEVARTWRLYMSAARLGFERGELDVCQLLLAKPLGHRPAPLPLRAWW